MRLGGIGDRAARPCAAEIRPGGGPQMVETSHGGKRVYVTDSFYGAWDDQLYLSGMDGQD